MKNAGMNWTTGNGITVYAKLTATVNYHFYNIRRAREWWKNDHLRKNIEK